ncbi:MAG: hypothetical protein KA956_09785 [Pyrinomonadaceae bacterium]|nr:hypothetical protein [Acidobacteriota bacterium]MBK7934197.1 hypothetical protein [Acidobacteriota bacterium]MBP7376755.1 hypothetical protein [Pyrinomonadaceae bacterium]
MEQPVPKVSEADVERIVDRDFGKDKAAEVLSSLRGFDTGPRVRLAILKVANGDLERLQEAGKVAIQDYRDILSEAEYPRYMDEIGFEDTSETLRQAVIQADWLQYQEWLQRK